ncbi:MAG: extracellular solute-binding protein, partial [Armatimonadetes bacterium]|nr:extracellular solute-binding protein [Armatimonadota bacterium]
LVVEADRKGACEPQLLTWSQDELEKAFADQKLACLVTRGSFEEELGPGKEERRRWAVTTLPGQPPFMTASVDCFVIPRRAEQPEAAAKFLAFVLSSEGQAQIAEAGGLPIDARLAQLSDSPSVRTAGACLKTLRGLPHRDWRPLMVAVERAFYVAVSGRRSVSRALEDAEEAYNQTLYGH